MWLISTLDNTLVYCLVCGTLLFLLVQQLLSSLSALSNSISLTADLNCTPPTHQPLEAASQTDTISTINVSTQADASQSNECTQRLKDAQQQTDGDLSDAIVTSSDDCEQWKQKAQDLQKQLIYCQHRIESMSKVEQQLRDRFCDEVRRQFEQEGNKFEDVNMDQNRPTMLIRAYTDMYSEARQEAIDVLEQLPEIPDQLHHKLVFSLVVLCFRGAHQCLRRIKDDLRELLMVESTNNNSARVQSLLLDIDSSVSIYLRKTAHLRDVTNDAKVIYGQLCSTLFDYPTLKDCSALQQFTSTCLKLAWSLTVQNPSYSIDYDLVGQTYDPERHTRFHTSNAESTVVSCVMWPALVEETSAVCVSRAIVVT